MNEILNMYQDGRTGFIDIYGAIVPDHWVWSDDDVDTSAASFKKQLNNFEDIDEIVVNINSPGGSVFEGVTIFNMLKNHKAKIIVNIEGLAASIASVIAMAGDEVRMPSNAMLMIHNAMGGGFGNANEIRKFADDLEKINQTVVNSYLIKNPSMEQEQLQSLLDAESWLSASEALELGFVDEVLRSVEAVAQIDTDLLNKYENVPEQIKNMVETPKNTKAINGQKIKVELDTKDFRAEINALMESIKVQAEEDDIEKRVSDLEKRVSELEGNEEEPEAKKAEPQNKFKNILF